MLVFNSPTRWHFLEQSNAAGGKILQVPDSVGDAYKAIAPIIRDTFTWLVSMNSL